MLTTGEMRKRSSFPISLKRTGMRYQSAVHDESELCDVHGITRNRDDYLTDGHETAWTVTASWHVAALIPEGRHLRI
jgi:hypothetical protein